MKVAAIITPVAAAVGRLRRRVTNDPVVVTFTRIWPFLRQERRRLTLAITVALLLTAVEVATPLLVGRFLDLVLQAAQAGVARAATWGDGAIIALLVVAALARGLLVTQQRAMAGRIGEDVAARLRRALWKHVQQLPLDYSQRRGAGRIMMRFVSDTRAVQRLVTQGVVQLSQEILLGCGVLIALFVLSWRMGLAVLLILPLYGLLFGRLNPQLRQASRSRRRRRSRISAYLSERVGGMVAVKALVRQKVEGQHFNELNRDLARRGARLSLIDGKLQGAAATIVALSGVAVLALAALEAAAGRLTGGSLVAFYTLLGLLMPIFQRVIVANRYIQEAHISVERLSATLALAPESPADDRRPPLVVSKGALAIEQVSFSYHSGPPVLDRIDLHAQPGELVAVVGANGAGKSTLLKLLLRFHTPTDGRVLIDDQDLAQVSLASLRVQIGLVTQDTPLFSGTVADSIRYGIQGGVPEEQIERAVQLTGADQVIAALPNGWATEVGTLGQSLSAGQRQLLALTRALAADPPILVLDEASSSLDAETEQALAAMVHALSRHKTVIVAAHRLPTLLLADRIYVLEHGRVAEVGTHETLLRHEGVYAQLFNSVSDSTLTLNP